MTHSLITPTFFLCFILVQTSPVASSTFSDSLSPKDKKELKYLLGSDFKKKVLYSELSRVAQKRSEVMSQVFLQETAKTERIKREEFIKDNPWKKWEKLENFNALNRWLQKVSPIITQRPSTKDTP